jgi:hypothetical protein
MVLAVFEEALVGDVRRFQTSRTVILLIFKLPGICHVDLNLEVLACVKIPPFLEGSLIGISSRFSHILAAHRFVVLVNGFHCVIWGIVHERALSFVFDPSAAERSTFGRKQMSCSFFEAIDKGAFIIGTVSIC